MTRQRTCIGHNTIVGNRDSGVNFITGGTGRRRLGPTIKKNIIVNSFLAIATSGVAISYFLEHDKSDTSPIELSRF